ncbi:LuxR C-terminal-related transcriptional regulator [Uliginosibacterium sp. H3]|uniref:LuxR C-terminal-related transcriptional regulator n=2 Tax=Uliginosibacterium silvisoli TaxID=3114758 RepID=A0ABU6JYU7_9RHOO|nr:LuxR C-terminal-related transcriptional regulator [Uliginosibacterium sp. H3]
MVHIVDDDAAIRDALGFLLRTHGIASQSWADAESFLLDYRDSMRGCILLDVRMSAMTGPECFDVLRGRGCRMPVVFLTGHGDVPLAVDALRAGAIHFIEKPPHHDLLLSAVREALAGDLVAQQEIAHRAELATRIEQLSPREREVMGLILEGKLNKIIADELDISMRTVEVHRSNVFDKMGVRSAVELATLLSKQG